VQSQYNGEPATLLRWTFKLSVSFSSIKATTGVLSAVQKSMLESKPQFAMSFGIGWSEVSQKAQDSLKCSVTDLFADARAQAQKMAGATGAILGSVVGMSAANFLTDSGNNPFAQGALPTVCALTVKFAISGGF